MWTDDPVRDADQFDRRKHRRLEMCPVCSICMEPIQDEQAYFDGIEWAHEDCVNAKYRRYVEAG